MSLEVLNTIEQLRARRPERERAVVMTMGGLHQGHADLIDTARSRVGPAGEVLVTIFVNPLQFGPGEDLDRYPRTLAADLELCEAHGVDVVFVPEVSEVYREDSADITVDPGELGTRYEGEVRPGHFRGVLTVVLKLLNLTRPDVAVFGEKDYQQFVLVRRMVRALDLPVKIVGVPTAREPDGLARSSRNRYFSAADRARAEVMPRAMAAARSAARAGAPAEAVTEAALAVFGDAGLTPDYVVVTDPELGPAPTSGAARILLAVHVAGVHLLDNAEIQLADPVGSDGAGPDGPGPDGPGPDGPGPGDAAIR